VLACLLLGLSLHAFAQEAGRASVAGRVTDASGAAVAQASVTLSRPALGLKRQLETDSKGLFSFVGLVPGEYALDVTAAGFGPRNLPKLAVEVGRTLEVPVRLDVAGRTEEVEVASSSALPWDASAVVDGVIGAQEIENLPLNGRNYLELAFLVPGNAPAPNFDPTKTNSVVVSSAGQLGRGGNIMIDGADNNDDAVGGPLQNLPQDAVQEFQIATNRYSAEQGRSAS
jgi:hypothetical protein